MKFDISKFKKKMPMKKDEEESSKKKKKSMTSPSDNFMKRFSAAK